MVKTKLKDITLHDIESQVSHIHGSNIFVHASAEIQIGDDILIFETGHSKLYNDSSLDSSRLSLVNATANLNFYEFIQAATESEIEELSNDEVKELCEESDFEFDLNIAKILEFYDAFNEVVGDAQQEVESFEHCFDDLKLCKADTIILDENENEIKYIMSFDPREVIAKTRYDGIGDLDDRVEPEYFFDSAGLKLYADDALEEEFEKNVEIGHIYTKSGEPEFVTVEFKRA